MESKSSGFYIICKSTESKEPEWNTVEVNFCLGLLKNPPRWRALCDIT